MTKRISHSYYVVMIDYPAHSDKFGPIRPASQQAIVDPEITRREVVARIKSGEYKNISFIHHIDGMSIEDVTEEINCEALPNWHPEWRDHQADKFDHARDLRKHEVM